MHKNHDDEVTLHIAMVKTPAEWKSACLTRREMILMLCDSHAWNGKEVMIYRKTKPS